MKCTILVCVYLLLLFKLDYKGVVWEDSFFFFHLAGCLSNSLIKAAYPRSL